MVLAWPATAAPCGLRSPGQSRLASSRLPSLHPPTHRSPTYSPKTCPRPPHHQRTCRYWCAAAAVRRGGADAQRELAAPLSEPLDDSVLLVSCLPF